MDIITYALLKKKLEKKADLNSPHFTGEPTAPTPDLTDDSDRIATTAFVQDLIEGGGGTDTKYVISRDGEEIVLTGTDGRESRADLPIKYGSTAYWNSYPSLIGEENTIYVYLDHDKDSQNNDIPGFKIGDGLGYLIDAPFVTANIDAHMQDNIRHITAAERTAWNNKVRCYIAADNEENLVFTTN